MSFALDACRRGPRCVPQSQKRREKGFAIAKVMYNSCTRCAFLLRSACPPPSSDDGRRLAVHPHEGTSISARPDQTSMVIHKAYLSMKPSVTARRRGTPINIACFSCRSRKSKVCHSRLIAAMAPYTRDLTTESSAMVEGQHAALAADSPENVYTTRKRPNMSLLWNGTSVHRNTSKRLKPTGID